MERLRRWTERGLSPLVLVMAIAASCEGGRGAEGGLDWSSIEPSSGMVVDGAVEIDATAGGSYPLGVVEEPSVGGDGYQLAGQIRYEDVQGGPGYLEMWSVFPDGGRYFTRTLADAGPMAAIQGASDWRAVQLPFFLEGTTSRPVRLEVNLVLPGRGHVWVGSLELSPLGSAAPGAWWSDRAAGLGGGMAGALIGILGALLGTLASRGRARRFVEMVTMAMLVLGIALLACAAAALVASQPYSVTWSLLLGGTILTLVFGMFRRTVRGVYARAELRRMRALDVGA